MQLYGEGLNYCLTPDPALTPKEQHERAMQLLHAVTQYAEELERIRDREYLHIRAHNSGPHPRPHRTEEPPQWTESR